MKQILLKSAKKNFQELRKKSPIFSEELLHPIHITKTFLDHIRFPKEPRTKEDLERRLLLFPFLEEAIRKGKLVSIRERGEFEYIQVFKAIQDLNISCIFSRKKNSHRIILYSCFLLQKSPVLACSDLSRSWRPGLIHSYSSTKKPGCQLLAKKVVQNFLDRENLGDKKLGVFVSGGVDSMVLLDVFSREISVENLCVLHVNHGTREACEIEEKKIREICERKNIKFFVERINPSRSPLVRGEDNTQKSQENYWRKFRKNFGEKIKKQENLNRILTAHHATDLTETMIFRLTKGAGISGMAPFDIGTKPFWDVAKSVILEYAVKNEVWWSEDISNQDTEKFERNLIRHEVLPVLRKITPNLEKVMVKNFLNFKNMEDFLEEEVLKIHSPLSEKNPPKSSFNKEDLKEGIKPINLQKFLDFPVIVQQEFLRKVCISSERVPLNPPNAYAPEGGKTPSFSEMTDFFRWLRNNPPGNSQKELAGKKFWIKKGEIFWE